MIQPRSPKDLIFLRPEVLASRLTGGRISRDGTHAPEKFETMVHSRWELYGQPGSLSVMAISQQLTEFDARRI
jgi:hypothetical protein